MNEKMNEHEVFRKYLKSEGLRFTPERTIILEEAFSIHEHFEAEDLLFSKGGTAIGCRRPPVQSPL